MLHSPKMLPPIITINKQKILDISAKYGASNVRVFGSYARGDNTHTSDIDFLMDIETGKSLLNRIALKQELEDLLKISIDIAKPETLHEAIKEQVLSEAIPL
ncbi:nucleotidyltransferase family protein [Oscillatoria acuminata]|uniref:Putative nucleotidyltransferase n=1 Tax=Oscillatoria acuminata PCC 6304 TaxID=56110 RepID=K9THM0_9CYAN|nr:nucleotidyltransferase family protein [Oscillatoria acuminata]AFY81524.1 putative nucleotidyltransferase [Oscillatoria acuminata PCC 6304]